MRLTLKQQGIAAFVLLLALFFIWPNFIHEPLHRSALQLQGSDGVIHFSWQFPATPVTEKLMPVSGIFGGLLYVLLPSIVSIILLTILWFTKGNIFTHGSLPIYLSYDLVKNLLGYASPTNDFHFLIIWPWAAFLLAIVFTVIGVAFLWKQLKHIETTSNTFIRNDKLKK